MNEEDKVFYFKMKADYNKYLAESEIHKEITSDEALKYYNECLKISEKMSFGKAVKLGFLLNMSVFFYEVKNEHKKAIEIAQFALNNFNKIRNKLDEDDDEVKHSISIVNLIEENLEMWKE